MKNKEILIVEDSAVQAELLRRLLVGQGYRVTIAKNGIEALEAAHEWTPNLVISDISMPGMDGYELCRKLKENISLQNIAVVLLTRLIGIKEIAMSLNTRADAYIAKPYNEKHLLKIVESLISGEDHKEIVVNDSSIEIFSDNDKYEVKADIGQIIKLLLSTYENTIEQNRELHETQNELRLLNKNLDKMVRKKAVELKASEERLYKLMETLPDIVYRLNNQGIITYINEAVRQLGYEPEELRGYHFSILIHPEDLDKTGYCIDHIQNSSSRKELEAKSPEIGFQVRILRKTDRTKASGVNFIFADVNCSLLYEHNLPENINHLTDTKPDDSLNYVAGISGVIRDITKSKELEENLTESENRYRSLVETAQDAIVTIDSKGKIVSWNQGAEAIFEYSYSEVKEELLTKIIPEKYRKAHVEGLERAVAGNPSKLLGKTIEITGLKKGGQEFSIELSLSRWQSKGHTYFTGIIRDISKRKESEVEIQNNYLIQSVINSILHISLEPITLFEQLGKILDLMISAPWFEVESKGCIFLREGNSKRLDLIVHRGMHKELLVKCKSIPFGKCLCGQSAMTGEVVFKNCMDEQHVITFNGITPHGHYCVPVKSRKKVLGVINLYVKTGHRRTPLEEDFLNAVANTIAGIVERKRSEERLEYLANFDTLTGLPNRVLFFDRLTQAIRHSKRYSETFALLYLDLDNFKCINDTMGHETGDFLLKEVSSRLSRCLRQTDTVARMSGDEFTIILTNIGKPEEATYIAKKIIDSLNTPYLLGEISCTVTTSIGISICPQDGTDNNTLIKNADIAMYQAKAAAGNNYRFFSAEMNTALYERIEMENSLKGALQKEEFVLHYQPQIDLFTGEIVGMEALIRWVEPEKGIILPDRFIPLAEETCLIIPIGEWVLHQACKDNKYLQNKGVPPIKVAVNMSLCQFIRQENLMELVARILFEAGLKPEHLELELTESICMENVENTVHTLKEFNSMGVELSIDDFGTGYSSLSYLKHLPIKKLKIDRSFIKDLPDDPDDETIVTTIIAMAHNLKMKVIAEGVETVNQLKFLHSLKCDEVQGYLFSKPLPLDEFIEFIKNKERFQSVLSWLKRDKT